MLPCPMLFSIFLRPQFLGDNPGDPDLEQALQENQEALVKKRCRAKALRDAIAVLRSANPHLAERPVANGSNTNTNIQSADFTGILGAGGNAASSAIGDGNISMEGAHATGTPVQLSDTGSINTSANISGRGGRANTSTRSSADASNSADSGTTLNSASDVRAPAAGGSDDMVTRNSGMVSMETAIMSDSRSGVAQKSRGRHHGGEGGDVDTVTEGIML